jgi:excisionase family DNA binding protein
MSDDVFFERVVAECLRRLREEAPRDTLLTINEVAEELRCHHQTVRNEIRRGRLPHIKLSGKIMIRRRDVEAFLMARSA